MTSRNQTRLQITIAVAVVIGIFVFMVVDGFISGGSNVFTVSEILAAQPPVRQSRVQVRGTARKVNPLAPRTFQLTHEHSTLDVEYVGDGQLPGSFREEAPAIVTGMLNDNGVFLAQKVQCKCGTKYESSEHPSDIQLKG